MSKKQSEVSLFKFITLTPVPVPQQAIGSTTKKTSKKNKEADNNANKVIGNHNFHLDVNQFGDSLIKEGNEKSLPDCLRENLNQDINPCPPWGRNERVYSIGIGDLMVVKQHIKRYEAAEIAHIENIMAGEERDRTQRLLERVEDIFTIEYEQTTESEREQKFSEKVELSNEIDRTIKEDQKYGFDLSISGKYGTTVIDSNFNYSASSTRDESESKSSNYAKNIIDRSLERVKERTREERITKIFRETEEINKHVFKNGTGDQKSGIYQFIDKIYEAQVFNYGKRQMFDVVVPEPASYLWHLEENPEQGLAHEIEPAPEEFNVNPFLIAPSSDYMEMPGNWVHYGLLIKKYKAKGVMPLGERKVTVSVSKTYPRPTESEPGIGAAGDPGAPRFVEVLEAKIPDGYIPVSAIVNAVAVSDAPRDINIRFNIDEEEGRWIGGNFVSDHANIKQGKIEISLDSANTHSELNDNLLNINVLLYDTSTWTIHVKLECILSRTALEAWQLATYDKIQEAYMERMSEWNEKHERYMRTNDNSNSDNPSYGRPPAYRTNVIVNELKKHCISLLTGYWYENNDLLIDNGEDISPDFDLRKSEQYGRIIQFLENAFEWHQIQYAFYPYYWSDKRKWKSKFLRNDPDYEYQQFLQSGAARVVFPVRPGFEFSVNFYLEKGRLPESDSANVLTNSAYLSIVDQLKEQTGGELSEPVPIGETWEVRVPTSFILLKKNDELPEWERLIDETWAWKPIK